jgi:predicted methyltransferase
MMTRFSIIFLALLCAAPVATADQDHETALRTAIAGEWREAEAAARDRFRNPYETLTFFGLAPGMTVLEIQPGATPWWTEILAPYARMTGGRFYATGADLYHTLKPGGVLGLKQHRADPDSWDPGSFTGYLPESLVIEHAERAGFVLDARAEINANPRDTKDHPFGVWTLPPIRASAPLGSGQAPAADFDRVRYDAIGESDRMTLRFRKPE